MRQDKKTAVFLGRFQPFHIGHMSIVDKIFQNDFDRLLLIIGSSDKSGTDENPWTLQQREEIIRASIPLELQEKIDIVGLEDVPDDDEWCLDLQNLIESFVNNEKGNELLKTLNSKLKTGVVLFTGNEWVRDICARHNIPTDWIIPTIDISASKIREMIKKGENVSLFSTLI